MKKTHGKLVVITVVLVLAVAVLGYVGWAAYQDSKPITVAVSLSDADRAAYEAKVAEYNEKLSQPDPEDTLGRTSIDNFIEKARYQGYLGRLSEAEATLLEGLKLYETSVASMHNLGRLNEQMGRYKKAIKYYERLADPYDYNQPQYYQDIARLNKQLGRVQAAGDAYWSFQTAFKLTPDADFEQWLRDHNYTRP